MSELRIEHMVLGPMATNCYLVLNEETREIIIVDPADVPERIARSIDMWKAKPVAILLTHGHFDHIGAAAVLRNKYDVPVCAMEEERQVLSSSQLNLSEMFGYPLTLEADVWLQDDQKLNLAGRQITVLYTPGHTKGGACYYLPEDGVLFSGDTLFLESVGRTDFPTGSMSTLVRSIQGKLMTLPEDTRVLPGHNEETVIGHEIRHNPYGSFSGGFLL